MAYNVIFTLTSAGSDSGPFDISGTTSSNTTILIASNVSKSTLQAGYEVTISDDNVTGGTVASTGVCTNTQPWIKPTGVTPTPTPGSGGTCWTFTYSTFNQPTGVSVRWTNVINGETETMLITDVDSIDNGDSTITAYICVNNTGTYSTPVCVESGIEVTCPGGGWINTGCSCTNNSTCALGCD